MKRVLVFILALAIFFPGVVCAQTVDNGKNVTLSKDAVVNENYFAAGNAVTVSGTVNGDSYIAGGSVTIDGTMNGDVFVAGGTLNIMGTVTGDLRIAGGQVTVSGIVDGNITALGGNVTVVSTATVGKSLVLLGGQMNIMAPVTTGMVLAGGQITVSNKVGGNVLAAAGTLVLTPNARITGNLNYYSENKALIQPGSKVTGRVNFHKQKYTHDIQTKTRLAESASRGAGLFFKIYHLIASFIIGALFIYFMPKFMRKATDEMHAKLLRSAGMGFLILVVTPVLILVLFATIIGIPIALFTLFGFMVYLYVAHIFAGLYVGEKFFGFLKTKQSSYFSLFAGLFILALLTSVPFFGWMVGLAATLIGMGALLQTKKSYFAQLKAKNLL
jgi:hypothetical protein